MIFNYDDECPRCKKDIILNFYKRETKCPYCGLFGYWDEISDPEYGDDMVFFFDNFEKKININEDNLDHEN